jgi:hypothetical protein
MQNAAGQKRKDKSKNKPQWKGIPKPTLTVIMVAFVLPLELGS